MDLIEILSIFIIPFRQDKDDNKKLKINNPGQLSNLGQIDHIMFDQAGILANNPYEIKNIVIDNLLFKIDKKDLQEII